jgi:hypothetical protein
LHIAGQNPTCALYESGSVRCWGSVSNVGGVAQNPSGCSGVPVDLERIEGAVRLHVSDRICAVITSGEVVCLPKRSNGSDTTPRVARKIAGVSATEDLLFDRDFGCVRTKTAAVRCWPWSSNGNNEAAPAIEVGGIAGALEIAIGETTFSKFVCARLPQGKVACARLIERDGNAAAWASPKEVSELAGATEIHASGPALCGRTKKGVRCFQVDWDTGQPSAAPAPRNAFELPLLLTRGVERADLDDDAGCQLLHDATVRCKLGESAPFVVPSLGDARELVSDGMHGCALRATGEVACWGSNVSYGAGGWLGQRVTIQPGHEHVGEVVELTDAVQIAVGSSTSCARKRDGGVVCWGAVPGQGVRTVPTRLPALEPASIVAVGDGYVCAATPGGKVACTSEWTKEPSFPRPVVSLRGSTTDLLIGLDDGALHSARLTAGAIAKEGARMTALGPAPVTHAASFASIANTSSMGTTAACTCAIPSSPGPVLCWGPNSLGVCGAPRGEWRTPVPVAEITDAVEVVGGVGFGCARRASGRVTCWGSHWHDKARTGIDPFESVNDAVGLTAGSASVCALRASGAYACDDNSSGALSPLGRSLELKALVQLPSGARGLALGRVHACALHADGRVLCLDGHLDPSVLGDGSVLSSDVPLVVKGL